MDDEERAFTRIGASRWAGVAPYRTLRPPRVSPAFVLYGRLIFVFYGGAMAAALVVDMKNKYNRAETVSRKLLLSFLLIISMVSITGVMYTGMYNAEIRLRRTFRHFARLKKIRRTMGGKPVADPAIEQVCMFYFGIQILLLMLNVSDICVFGQDYFLEVLFVFSFLNSAYLVTNIVTMQFVIVAMIINSSFRMITDKLEETVQHAQIYGGGVTKNKDKKNDQGYKKFYYFTGYKIPLSTINITIDMLGMVAKDATGRHQMPHETVRCLAHAYVRTCEVMRQQYHPETGLLLLLLGSILTNLVNRVYCVMKDIQECREVMALLGMVWCMLHLCRGMLLVAPSHAMSSEIQRSHSQLIKLLHTVRSRDAPLLAELNVFLLHLTLNQPSYVVLGMYSMKRPLLLTMLAICTTYLAIFQELY